jgi:hypothetical protein
MYDLTFGQNGHFSQKNHVFFMPHVFSQSGHPFVQCEHFIQVEPFEKLWFLIMKENGCVVAPMLPLQTHKDISLTWTHTCLQVFEEFKMGWVNAPISVQPILSKVIYVQCWLATHVNIRSIIVSKGGTNTNDIKYSSKGLYNVQRICHQMAKKCYVIIWGILHFL